MSRQAQPTRMRDALAVADQYVGRDRQPIERLDHRRCLAEAQQARDIREGDILTTPGPVDQLQRVGAKHHHRGIQRRAVLVKRDVGAAHRPVRSERTVGDHSLGQFRAGGPRGGRVEGPTNAGAPLSTPFRSSRTGRPSVRRSVDSSVHERHRRDHRRLDPADDLGGLLDLLAGDVQVRAGPQHLRPQRTDQNAVRAQVGGHLGGGAQPSGQPAPRPGWSRPGRIPARSLRFPRTPRPAAGRGRGPLAGGQRCWSSA